MEISFEYSAAPHPTPPYRYNTKRNQPLESIQDLRAQQLFARLTGQVIGRTCGIYGAEAKCIQGLVGNLKEKRLLGKPRSRWTNTINSSPRHTKFPIVKVMPLPVCQFHYSSLYRLQILFVRLFVTTAQNSPSPTLLGLDVVIDLWLGSEQREVPIDYQT
jgi:hypothetical protein